MLYDIEHASLDAKDAKDMRLYRGLHAGLKALLWLYSEHPTVFDSIQYEYEKGE